jgi:hypothetical protein
MEDLSIDTAFSQVRLVVKKILFVKILNLGMCGPAMGGKYFTEALSHKKRNGGRGLPRFLQRPICYHKATDVPRSGVHP